VLIVSKPSFECIKQICDTFADYKDHILFRFTIGSTNNKTLKFWEPNAPDYKERKQALIFAFEAGYQTSISCEPMLDNKIGKVIDDLSQYVTDAIWLGKMNFAIRRLRTNGHLDAENLAVADQLLEWQDDAAIKQLYKKYKDNPKIKWKESIKKVVGLEVSTIKGEDK
jgi:DNA repair photolyase